MPPLADIDVPRRDRDTPLWVPGISAPPAAEPAPVREPPERRRPAREHADVDTDLDQDIDEAQRLVAEERAAIARIVLAERAGRAAAASAPAEAVRSRPAGPAPRARWASRAGIALGAAAVLVAARLWLVGTGALFGAGPVRAFDAVVAGAVLLALALSWDLLPARGDLATVARRIAVVIAAPVLVGGGLTLLVPATPASAPAAGCPGAPVRGAAYVAVTTEAASARSGPGRSYETSGRFPAGCSVGFTGYCLGDPVPDATWPAWRDSRWLLVDRADAGAGRLVARHLSGEPALPRFLPSAVLNAAHPESALPLLTAVECGVDGIRPAGEAVLGDIRPGPVSRNLTASAARATNLGFAVWIAPDPVTGAAPLLRGDPYRQIAASAGRPGGKVSVGFDYYSLIADLDLGRRTPDATLALLAVPCDAPATPVDPAVTAAVTTYSVTGVRLSGATARLTGRDIPAAVTNGTLRGLDLDRLATAACATPR